MRLSYSRPVGGDSASMTFPVLFSVGWHSFSEGAVDARNVKAAVYTPGLDAGGVSRAVITWYSAQQVESDEVRVESDLVLLVPPDFGAVSPRDVCDVPGEGRFEVVGYAADWTKSPYGFAPGKAVKLKRVES